MPYFPAFQNSTHYTYQTAIVVITRKGADLPKTKAGVGKQRPILSPPHHQASKHQIISEKGGGKSLERDFLLFGTRKRLKVEGGAGILRKTLGVLTLILNTR